MGFKRVLLQRVQITEDHTLVNMDDDGPSATRKPTDFSIKRILSENKESVEQNVKEIALNSEVNANQLAWNNYYRFLLPYYAHHQHQQQNHHYQLLANRMQQLTPPVTGATAGLYGSFNGLHQAHHLLKSYATPHPTQIPLPPSTTHPLYPSLRIEMLNSMKAKQLIQTVNQPKLSTAGDGITVKSEKSLTNEINNNCDMDKMLKYEPIPIKEELYCYKCKICDKVFENLIIMEAHEKSHKTTRYECEECGKGFSQLRNYKYHISVHRGTKEFAAKCPECGKVFNDKGYLSSHLKIHRNKKEYACPHCPKCFNQRVAFNMHVRIHTGVKPHICQECGKRFSRKMLLKQHLRTHSGEKPYQCAVCGKTFADRSNMTLHHKLHSGVKPFACPICPKAFTKKHHLKTHLNYHTGCKPYRCPHPNCNQSFTQSSNMRTHSKKCQFRPIDSTCL